MQSNSTVYVYIVQQEDSIKFGEKMAAETVTHRQMFANKFSFPQEGHIKLDFLSVLLAHVC